MSKIKNGGLDQYGAGPFEQQQFGTAGVEGVKWYFRHSTELNSVELSRVKRCDHPKKPHSTQLDKKSPVFCQS